MIMQLENAYICDKCHIVFYIRIQNHKAIECISMPNKTFRTKIYRPKAVCPRCKQESPYMIKIESD